VGGDRGLAEGEEDGHAATAEPAAPDRGAGQSGRGLRDDGNDGNDGNDSNDGNDGNDSNDRENTMKAKDSSMQPAERLRRLAAGLAIGAAVLVAAPAQAADALVTVRQLSPETAFKAAQAALAYCRTRGYQVGVAIVDRSGVTQVFMRDRFGGAHTIETATRKAWTAASFRTPTTVLAAETQAGRPSSGIRHIPGVVAVGGGMTIEAGGAVVGAIGVSGAPTGEADDECAKAGIRAIQADIEL
jgi:uncharacterized protein GlcG (DUF336 family)